MSGDDTLWVDLMSAMSGVLGTDDAGIDLATDLLAAIQPHVERADAAAARLRSLAAIYEQPSNRDSTFTFTGRELAAMLKEEG